MENNFGSQPKTVELWFTKKKINCSLPEITNPMISYGKHKYGKFQNNENYWTNAIKIWFSMGKLWYYTENHGTMRKTMELWITLGKKYGTMAKVTVLYMEK